MSFHHEAQGDLEARGGLGFLVKTGGRLVAKLLNYGSTAVTLGWFAADIHAQLKGAPVVVTSPDVNLPLQPPPAPVALPNTSSPEAPTPKSRSSRRSKDVLQTTCSIDKKQVLSDAYIAGQMVEALLGLSKCVFDKASKTISVTCCLQ